MNENPVSITDVEPVMDFKETKDISVNIGGEFGIQGVGQAKRIISDDETERIVLEFEGQYIASPTESTELEEIGRLRSPSYQYTEFENPVNIDTIIESKVRNELVESVFIPLTLALGVFLTIAGVVDSITRPFPGLLIFAVGLFGLYTAKQLIDSTGVSIRDVI